MTDDRKLVANIAPFGLRMQPDLKARVEEAARKNNRSVNAEIVSALEAAFPPKRVPTNREMLEALEAIMASNPQTIGEGTAQLHDALKQDLADDPTWGDAPFGAPR